MREVLERARPLAEVLWPLETASGPLDTPERRAALEQRLEDAGPPDRRPRRSGALSRFLPRAPLSPRSGAGALPVRGRGAAETGRGRPDFRAVRRRRLPPDGAAGDPALLRRRQQEVLLALLLNHPFLLNEVAEDLART